MKSRQTHSQRLFDLLLGAKGPLDDFVNDRRNRGEPWRIIARDLYLETGEDITGETLRAWYVDQAS